MLKRTAQFVNQNMSGVTNTTDQNIKLQIPKKTKLFLEQAVREKENPLRKCLKEILFKGLFFNLISFKNRYSSHFSKGFVQAST